MVSTGKTVETTIVKPQGKITAANVNEFRQELLTLIESGSVNLLIDLADVDMIDSKGLAVFIVCHKTVTAKGGSLTVVTDNNDLLGLFRVMRLDEHFTVRGSE
jgi:anti-sigma B factor antagonist